MKCSQAGLDPVIFLIQPPQCWNYRQAHHITKEQVSTAKSACLISIQCIQEAGMHHKEEAAAVGNSTAPLGCKDRVEKVCPDLRMTQLGASCETLDTTKPHSHLATRSHQAASIFSFLQPHPGASDSSSQSPGGKEEETWRSTRLSS